MRTGSVCTGYGGLDRAVHEVLGGELAWVADNDPGAAAILAHRFPAVPNLGDIAATEWGLVEPVDLLTAGFPCQDVSCAGARKGLRAGNRTGVWAHVATAIGTLRPSLVVLENVRGLLTFGADSNLEPCPWCMGDSGDESVLRACGAVLADLADLGFDAEWVLVSAAEVGAPHRRERVFILAWPAAAESAGVRLPFQRREHFPGGGRAAVVSDRWDTTEHDRLADEGLAGTADADCPVGDERRIAAPGEAQGWRARPDACRRDRASAADAEHHGLPGTTAGREGESAESRQRGQWRLAEEPAGDRRERDAVADAGGARLGQHSGEPPAQEAGTPAGDESPGDRGLRPAIEWGPYALAIRRWEHVTARPAPRPTEPGRTGERLSPRFVEWMMGLPEGWVTDVPGLSRNAQLKALGNGVVPQQAAMALRLLLDLLGITPLVAAEEVA